MSADPLTLPDLPWLPRPWHDFKDRLAQLLASPADDWPRRLPAFAQQALTSSQAAALSRVVEQMRGNGTVGNLTSFKLGILSNATIDFIVPFLKATALRYGIALEVVAAEFGNAAQAALDPQSSVNLSRPDAVLLALDHRALPFRVDDGVQWPPFRVEAAAAELNLIRQAIRRHSGAICLVQSIAAPMESQFGSLDFTLRGSMRAVVADWNGELARGMGSSGDVLVDVEALAHAVGLDVWHAQRDWHLAKLPFSRKAVPIYCEFVVRAIAALRGKSRKCLVMDLDNTIWGGVIGDDGLAGISLDQGDARGEAHRALQSAILDLRRRGIVLAVCSKNDDATARLPFREHKGMLLKEDDIAVFVANWEDKASNLERIASRLELGLDALVFLDDNPAERLQVREALPMVAVPEMGDDPSSYVRTLLLAGYFESVALTSEDLSRADQYNGNIRRLEMQETSRDLGDFLQSLQMQIHFAAFQATGRKRVVQLINKTNQFNTTTRRYTENQIAELESSPDHFTLQVGLVDRFGDNGVISAVICRCGGVQWEIDTWLMSCRVLNRKVEEAVCNHLAQAARAAGAERLVGAYRPTERNKLVASLFSRLGFVRMESPETDQRWVLDLAEFQGFDVPMTASS